MSHTVVIGADPAGLTVAYELSKNRYPVTVLEASAQVGGLFRTQTYQGYRIGLGRYGFETDIPLVRQLWDSLLQEESVPVAVRSLVYFRDRLFKYPFSLTNALKHLGPIDTSLTGLSYLETWLNSQLSPIGVDGFGEDGFEDAESWLKKRFGAHLYRIFLASYFHKLWGRPARQLHADCALEMTQSLFQGSSLMQAVMDSALGRDAAIKTQYPALGVGQLWQHCQSVAVEQGAKVRLNTPIKKLKHSDQRIEQIGLSSGDAVPLAPGDQVVSSLPLATLVHRLDPPAPANVMAAADCLRYRSLIVVALVIDHASLFSEHEIHVHNPTVQVSSIQNFKGWNVAQVADPQKTCLGMTYLCEQGDYLWQLADDDLVQLARRELMALKLMSEQAQRVDSGKVVRHVDAYPVRSVNYYQHKAVVQRYLEKFENLKIVGRYGFDGNTQQDISMLSGLMAARTLMRIPSSVKTLSDKKRCVDAPLSS